MLEELLENKLFMSLMTKQMINANAKHMSLDVIAMIARLELGIWHNLIHKDANVSNENI